MVFSAIFAISAVFSGIAQTAEWAPAEALARRGRFSQGSASNGIEIAAIEGASALALHDGTVAFAGLFT